VHAAICEYVDSSMKEIFEILAERDEVHAEGLAPTVGDVVLKPSS
jgi:hypothetical protein